VIFEVELVAVPCRKVTFPCRTGKTVQFRSRRTER